MQKREFRKLGRETAPGLIIIFLVYVRLEGAAMGMEPSGRTEIRTMDRHNAMQEPRSQQTE
jgi:hypothetical protein